jgi:hypothetical protein
MAVVTSVYVCQNNVMKAVFGVERQEETQGQRVNKDMKQYEIGMLCSTNCGSKKCISQFGQNP